AGDRVAAKIVGVAPINHQRVDVLPSHLPSFSRKPDRLNCSPFLSGGTNLVGRFHRSPSPVFSGPFLLIWMQNNKTGHSTNLVYLSGSSSDVAIGLYGNVSVRNSTAYPSPSEP
ncbi:hypothetical protein, partial [Sphingomonas sp. LH128]|uniref:hypothetical protein n=1 Tax=Sphingomonas sp. LH128 TaxID=473781 RepID=UPI002E10FD5B